MSHEPFSLYRQTDPLLLKSHCKYQKSRKIPMEQIEGLKNVEFALSNFNVKKTICDLSCIDIKDWSTFAVDFNKVNCTQLTRLFI